VDTSEDVKIFVRSKMTFYDWWKERVYGVKNRASTVFADNPVLVVLVNNKYEGYEFVPVRVAHSVFALYALRSCYLLRQDKVRG
jgi:hypothetical protein